MGQPLPPSSTIFPSPSPSLNKPSIASPSSQMKRVQLSEPRANPEISPSRCFTSSAQQNGASRDESVSSYQSVQDYANWDLDALKAEASKFGYKPPGTKIACVNLLTRISGILSRRASAEPSSASVSTPTRASKTVSKKNSTKRAPPVIGSAGVSSAKGAGGAEKKPTSQGNSTPKKCRKGRVSAASMADAGEDFGADDADEGINVDSSFEEGMRQAILNDKDLWIKMLRYQVSSQYQLLMAGHSSRLLRCSQSHSRPSTD